MKKFAAFALSFLLLSSLFVSEAFACTTFCLKSKSEVLFGRNYDWMIGDGLVFVNKRGVSKTSTQKENPAGWVSVYGSLTFNQYGRETPMGGMNEAGLVIELMWLDGTKYPAKDARPALDVLEWIQYQLDISATTEEVLKNIENVRIEDRTPLHYLVNDKTGNSATIEFLDGKLVARTGDTLPVSTLANDTYDKSLSYAKATQALGGSQEVPQTANSLDRFTRAALKTKEFEKAGKTEKEAVAYAFDILSNVAQRPGTQWSIVYDQKRGKVYFRTLQSASIKSVDLKSFDYACGSVVKMLDINSKETGDVTSKFIDYTRAANRDLIERSFGGTDFLKNTPAETKNHLAEYPESFACAAKTDKKSEIKKTNAAASGNFNLYYYSLGQVFRLLLKA
ncbi:MAG: linear amide C-N hydrolase [Pyrinomonadaceae bacterium]